jgi:predicted Zn-dependent peptidase
VLQNSSHGGIINQLAFLELHGLDESYLTNYVKNIYAITPEKVQEMAQKYIREEDMTLVVVGDKKKIDNQVRKFSSEVNKAQGTKPKNNKYITINTCEAISLTGICILLLSCNHTGLVTGW